MHQTLSGQQKYYFSDQLKAELSRIPQYPLTVVEAPDGFGKTTAVREYLRNEHPQAGCAWYTCLGEPASVAWMGICELFAEIDRKVADDLKNLKTPAMVFRILHHPWNVLAGVGHAGRAAGYHKCRMPQLYYFIFLAVAKQNTGDRQEARKYVRAAFDVALPDRVYLPLIEHECMLDLLSGLNMRQWNKGNSSPDALEGGALTDREKGSAHPGGARGGQLFGFALAVQTGEKRDQSH